MNASPAPSWQPRMIRRFIRSFPTGAGVMLVETDQGEGYAKVLGNPAGPHALAREWVGTSLASWLGLLTFDFAMVHVLAENELPLANGTMAQPGPAFITRAEGGAVWSGDRDDLGKLDNPGDLTLLVLCDTWLRNRDRWPGLDPRKPNRDNVFFSAEGASPHRFLLKAMDFSHCLETGDLNPRMARIDCIKDNAVYGLFPEFQPYLDPAVMRKGLDRLATLSSDFVRDVIGALPRAWEVDADTRDAMRRLICERAAYVHATLYGKFWPQRELPFSDDLQGDGP